MNDLCLVYVIVAVVIAARVEFQVGIHYFVNSLSAMSGRVLLLFDFKFSAFINNRQTIVTILLAQMRF